MANHISRNKCPSIIFMIISVGTVISSLQSDRLTKKLGAGKVTAISVGTTAIALLGFSFSHSFVELCLWASSYLVLYKGLNEVTAASLASMFYIGITVDEVLMDF